VDAAGLPTTLPSTPEDWAEVPGLLDQSVEDVLILRGCLRWLAARGGTVLEWVGEHFALLPAHVSAEWVYTQLSRDGWTQAHGEAMRRAVPALIDELLDIVDGRDVVVGYLSASPPRDLNVRDKMRIEVRVQRLKWLDRERFDRPDRIQHSADPDAPPIQVTELQAAEEIRRLLEIATERRADKIRIEASAAMSTQGEN
jgi:hypothetical protein